MLTLLPLYNIHCASSVIWSMLKNLTTQAMSVMDSEVSLPQTTFGWMFLSMCAVSTLTAVLSNAYSKQYFTGGWLWHRKNEPTVAAHSMIISCHILTMLPISLCGSMEGKTMNTRVPLHWPTNLPSLL
jgi:hypothetical protein